MKSFREYLEELTNVSAGLGVRGLGDVSGVPAGDISNYAAQNATAPPVAQGMVDQHNAMHTDALKAGIDADTKDNILKPRKK